MKIGLLSKAADAKNKSVIGKEKEQIALAYSNAVAENSGKTEVKSVQMKRELDNLEGKDKVEVSSAKKSNGEKGIKILYVDTQHLYFVKSGNVETSSVEECEESDFQPKAITSVYAILYEDGELVFNTTGNKDSTRGTLYDGSNKDIGNVEFENDDGKLPEWLGDDLSLAKQIKTVTFEDEIVPLSIACWFAGCENLTTISHIERLDTSNATSLECTFYQCKSLTDLDVSNFDTSNVTSLHATFYDCYELTSLNVSSFDTSKVDDMRHTFRWCYQLTNLDVSNFDTSRVTSFHSIFRDCRAIKNLDLSNFDTSSATDMCAMFYGCHSLKTLKISNFNTENVTDMNSLFRQCFALEEVDVSHFNTAKVTDMLCMFAECVKLETLDLRSFDTSNVEQMPCMFSSNDMSGNHMELREIKGIEDFKTGKVTNMERMFRNCDNLTSLDLHKWDVSKVENMKQLFNTCDNLEYLNLDGWDMSSVTIAPHMFNADSKLSCTFTVTLDSSKITDYGGFLNGAATADNTSITVNYTQSIEDKIDAILATGRGHIVKGEKITTNNN